MGNFNNNQDVLILGDFNVHTDDPSNNNGFPFCHLFLNDFGLHPTLAIDLHTPTLDSVITNNHYTVLIMVN